MPTDRTYHLSRILPAAVFDRLGSVMQQMALTDPKALVLTEAILPDGADFLSGTSRFMVVVASHFSGLVLAGSAPTATNTTENIPAQLLSTFDSQTTFYQVQLCFEMGAIATFLDDLQPYFRHRSDAIKILQSARQTLQPNSADIQSEFTLHLVELLISEPTTAPTMSCDLVVETALRQQVEQERLLNHVTTQIRQSMDLPVILQTAVRESQQLLQVDRVIIYEFERSLVNGNGTAAGATQSAKSVIGRITYEALATETIPSILHLTEGDDCFTDVAHPHEKYRRGNILAVDDIEATYVLSPCLLNFLRHSKARAKLVAPIVVKKELWGLLVAHQCSEPRHWQDYEKTFLQRIAEHLAIAIYQTRLYTQLQQQKEKLEQRVTERTQELDDALVAAQAASLAKTEFLAAMSHELRTPLTCVIGMAETLLRAMTQKQSSYFLQPEKQEEYLKIIKRSGEHLLELINDILDVSQVEAGKTVLNVSQFSLAYLAQQSLQMFREKARSHGIELVLDLRLDGDHSKENNTSTDLFSADRRRISQVLLNLLSNAIKFTPDGGRVTLRVWLEATTAVFQVEDTGIGIPKSKHVLLFQKFQQLDSTYHRRYEGTGLGLALTKQLVELHGGKIELESSVGNGSTFTVRIPAQSLSRSPSAEVREFSPVATAFTTVDTDQSIEFNYSLVEGVRIVLIEDNEETAMLVCDLLTAAGCQVVWMVDGLTALRQIEILQPPLVITDIQLPGMDGFEIIHFLRHNPAMRPTKILALTARTSQADKDRCLAEGADACLSKPVQPYMLLDKVAALMNGQRLNGRAGDRG